MRPTNQAEWLSQLRPLIHRWIAAQCARQRELCARLDHSNKGDPVPANEAHTRAYADLTLAFGLARLGRPAAETQRLSEEARRLVDPWDAAHDILFRAYEYRIGQA